MINKISYKEPKGKPKQLVVFLHGMGSNKDDLISLTEEFKSILPDALFMSPNAPHRCEFLAEGYEWFSLKDNDEIRIQKEIGESVIELNKFIDKVLDEYEISADNLYLIGFSQGATMSIYSSIAREVPVKGVLAYSGIIFNHLEVKSLPNITGLIHGEKDDVVPFAWHKHNVNVLNKYKFNFKEFTMPDAYHQIPFEAVEFGKKLLKENQ